MDEQQVSLPVIVGAALMFLGTVAAGFFNWLNKRGDSKDKERPTIEQVWARMDKMQVRIDDLEARLESAEKARTRAETFLRNIIDIFVRYVSRVQGGGDTNLTETERTTVSDAQKIVG